jgi:hypothetical protein
MTGPWSRLIAGLTEPVRQEWARRLEAAAHRAPADDGPAPLPQEALVDVRDRVDHWQRHASHGRRWYTEPRDALEGICVHQAGVEFGVAGYQVRASGSATEAMIDRICGRWSKPLPYHVFVSLRNRTAYWLHDWSRETWHGNAANRGFIGFGVDGDYPAWERNRQAKHTTLDDEMRLLVRCALRRTSEEATGVGGAPITAHAIADAKGRRTRDPGELIWGLCRQVAPLSEWGGVHDRPDWMT